MANAANFISATGKGQEDQLSALGLVVGSLFHCSPNPSVIRDHSLDGEVLLLQLREVDLVFHACECTLSGGTVSGDFAAVH
jgi:hypothetical protein